MRSIKGVRANSWSITIIWHCQSRIVLIVLLMWLWLLLLLLRLMVLMMLLIMIIAIGRTSIDSFWFGFGRFLLYDFMICLIYMIRIMRGWLCRMMMIWALCINLLICMWMWWCRFICCSFVVDQSCNCTNEEKWINQNFNEISSNWVFVVVVVVDTQIHLSNRKKII